MKKLITFYATCILYMSHAFSQTDAVPPISDVQITKLTGPLGFIENKGQFLDENKKPRTDLLYLFIREGLKVQLMQNRISFELTAVEANYDFDEATGFPHYYELDPEDRPTPPVKYFSNRIDVEFIGANTNPEIEAEEMMPDYLNYYLAFTPVDGIRQARQFNKITYKNLYPNIDLVLNATPEENSTGALTYDFVVHPGGNVSDIKYKYHGGQEQALNKDGTLETGTELGKISETIPESYVQNANGDKLKPADVSFYLNKDVIGFHAEGYDKKQSLVIDPYVVWATYCGGDTSEEGRGLCTDSSGNVILIGSSISPNVVATAGAFQTVLDGDGDIIIEKYDSLGNRLWGTYYGGSGRDHGRGIVADKLDNIYLGCHTNSPDGCATPGSHQPNYAGGVGDDGLLAYFGADGFRIWATYYGGSDDETMRRLSIDRDGNILMVGYTFSDTGIATPGVYQSQWGGDADLCVSKWSPDGHLIWGSYLGGTKEEHGRSLTHDKYNNVYVNGSVASDGVAVGNVSRPTHAGKQDYLLGKFDTNGQIAWVSYWGGAVEDRGRGVFVDSSSKYVYFTGYSASDTGVSTPGAYQEEWHGGYDIHGEPLHDAVLMKWTVDGQIVWSTYLGGSHDDRGRAITMIGDNEVYISGSTESDDSMYTPDGFQTQWGGHGDMYLEIFDSTGFRHYGSYFGGSEDEDNLALAIDDTHHNIYLVGTSRSDGLGTPGTAQPEKGGYDDALLVKIKLHDTNIGIGNVADPTTLSLYPNPTNNNFVLSFTNPKQEKVKVELQNMLGQIISTVYEGKSGAQFSKEINASGLSTGMYQVNVVMGNKTYMKKLIIEK